MSTPFDSPRSRNRFRSRLQAAAREECDAVLRPLKKRHPRLKEVAVRFEDAPDRGMTDAGLPPEAESTYAEPEVIVFLFNIHEPGNSARDFRSRVRRALLKELGDLVGEEFDWTEEAD